MHSTRPIVSIVRKIGSLLSIILVILTLVLSSVSIVETHDAPLQTASATIAVQSHIPANCHGYTSCLVYVVPSKMPRLTTEALHRLRFPRSGFAILAAVNPVFDTPPPRA
jgi:hypothetical protein